MFEEKKKKKSFRDIIINKTIDYLDNSFDYVFIILSIATVIFSFLLLFDFYNKIVAKWFDMLLLFEIWLTALISVKFYKVIKDYIWDHKIELSNLAEIWIVTILSKLIFNLESFKTEEVLIRILLLIVLIIFYYYEMYFKEKHEN